MRTDVAVTTPPTTAVCVGTLTDEHSASQSPLTARSGRRSITALFGRRFLKSLCSSLERAEGRGAALLLLHHGQLCSWQLLVAGGELGGPGKAIVAAFASVFSHSTFWAAPGGGDSTARLHVSIGL